MIYIFLYFLFNRFFFNLIIPQCWKFYVKLVFVSRCRNSKNYSVTNYAKTSLITVIAARQPTGLLNGMFSLHALGFCLLIRLSVCLSICSHKWNSHQEKFLVKKFGPLTSPTVTLRSQNIISSNITNSPSI